MRPDHVLGNKGYSSRAIRAWLRRRGIAHAISERSDQVRNRARRGSGGGRPPVFDKQVYEHRNVVERCLGRLKQWRGIATRYDKTAQYHPVLPSSRHPRITPDNGLLGFAGEGTAESIEEDAHVRRRKRGWKGRLRCQYLSCPGGSPSPLNHCLALMPCFGEKSVCVPPVPLLFEFDYLPLEHAKIYEGQGRHWVVV